MVRLPRARRSREASARTLRRRSAARRLVIEGALVAGAAGGLIVARQQGVSGPDPLTSAAPVLVAIPAGVLAVRLYPVLARGLLRAAGLRRGAVAYLGFARAARTTMISVLPAFALVLVLAVISFGGMVRAAVTRGEVAASWQQVGADAVINTQNVQPPLSPADRAGHRGRARRAARRRPLPDPGPVRPTAPWSPWSWCSRGSTRR